MVYPDQCANTPERDSSHREYKYNRDEASRGGTFAPGLEHGDDSNREQQDCTACKRLEPHTRFPSAGQLAIRSSLIGSTAVTRCGDGPRCCGIRDNFEKMKSTSRNAEVLRFAQNANSEQSPLGARGLTDASHRREGDARAPSNRPYPSSAISRLGSSFCRRWAAICLPWKRPFSMKISLVREPATITPAT